jgi:hypothetical protein
VLASATDEFHFRRGDATIITTLRFGINVTMIGRLQVCLLHRKQIGTVDREEIRILVRPPCCFAVQWALGIVILVGDDLTNPDNEIYEGF